LGFDKGKMKHSVIKKVFNRTVVLIRWKTRFILYIFAKVMGKLKPYQDIAALESSPMLVLFSGGLGDYVNFFPTLNKLKEKIGPQNIYSLAADPIKSLFSKEIPPLNCYSLRVRKNIFFIIPLLILIRRSNVLVTLTVVTGVYSILFELISLLSGAKYRIGPRYSSNPYATYNMLIEVSDSQHDVNQNIFLLKFLKVNHNEVNILFKINYNEKKPPRDTIPPNDRVIVGIHPGSDARFKNTKRWSVDNYQHVLNRIVEKYNALFLVFLGPDDLDLKNQFRSHSASLRFVENVELEVLFYFLKRCHLFVSNDTGLAHLANAFSIPTVTLFGPSSPVRTRPYGPQNRVLYRKILCSPCIYHQNYCTNLVSNECLNLIKPEDVYSEIEKVLKFGGLQPIIQKNL